MLACVRWNVQHRELKLLDFTRFLPIVVVMVAVPTSRPTGFLINPPSLSFQNAQPQEKAPASHMGQGETPTMNLALGANVEGKEIAKDKASRMQSSRIGFALVCVRWNAQHVG